MRCRAGDLAVMIRTHHPENTYKLVEVVCRHPHPDVPGPAWLVKSLCGPLRGSCDGDRWWSVEGISLDSDLRPLRDRPGIDETLRNLELTQ